MPTVYKNAQLQGTAGVTTYGTLYSTSASATAVISSILVANTASTTATYRIGIMGSAGTPGNSEWVAFGALVPANDTIALTLGLTLGNSQFVRISSSANTVTFSGYISEIT
jgi:CDP-diglyceride synthetase